MGSFYTQILDLLTTPPGNLTYHLVLAFSIAGALPAALNLWRNGLLPQGRRMSIGLILLLVTQMALIGFAGLAPAFASPQALLPILDRAVTALSLALFIWLWVFPESLRLADAATALIGLLVITLAIFSTTWWSAQEEQAAFNASLLDLLWGVLCMSLAFIGGLILLLRRPPSFENGLALFGLLFLGQLLHLIFPLPLDGDLPGAVRLSQLAAYPLTLTLPQRFGASAFKPLQSAGIQPKVFQSFLALGKKSTPQELCQAMAHTISQALLADLCLLLSPPDAQNKIAIHCCYDRAQDKFFDPHALESSQIPLLAQALRTARPLHLPGDSSSTDLTELGNLLGIQQLAGPLLSVPILAPGGSASMGILLLSPNHARQWTEDDQTYLAAIAKSLSSVLRHYQEMRSLEEQLVQLRPALQSAQVKVDQLQAKNKALLLQLESLQKQSSQDQALSANLAAMANLQQSTQETIARLQVENERLSHAIDALSSGGKTMSSEVEGQVIQQG